MPLYRSETHEQEAVVTWAAQQVLERRWPELAVLYAIPNGGHRAKRTVARLKAEGVRAGVSDLCLPVARGGYFGLYLEMKALDGSPSPEQVRWQAELTSQGYLAVVAWGHTQAILLLREYLGWPDTPAPTVRYTVRTQLKRPSKAEYHR